MLTGFKRLIGGLTAAGAHVFAPDDERVAAAALLVHVATVDGVVHASERLRLQKLLVESYNLPASETDLLIAAAERREVEAIDIQDLVDLVRRKVDAGGRAKLVEMMWDMAHADGHLHEFEENLIERTAKLLGVPPDQGARRLERGG